jgi:hypothetical protein
MKMKMKNIKQLQKDLHEKDDGFILPKQGVNKD